MPPYRQASKSSDKSRLPWSGDGDLSEEETFAYPTALVSSAKDAHWESPTKPVRKYTKTPKRRQNPNQGIERGRREQSGTATDTTSDDIGLFSLGWDQSDDVIDDPRLRAPETREDGQLAQYVDTVEAYSAGFYHVGGSLFVVEGWNPQRAESTVSCLPISLFL
jgi:hypothetical protein